MIPFLTTHLLPVSEARCTIVSLVKKNPAVIIVGETGSGKTTQIPQYIWDDIIAKRPLEKQGMVACTQPRRVAAVSIARHVAKQRSSLVGGEVGYAVRFDDRCSDATRIKFLTDGILLREIQVDPDLHKYACVILDEAHERTLHGDVLFGLLKAIVRRRQSSLKIVVMSATLNAEQFSSFWWNAPIGVVHGRTYPVVILHAVEPQADYVEAAVSTVLQIHQTEGTGDVLCFLTGQEEIEDAKRILEHRIKLLSNDVPDFFVLTLYAAMPYEQQLAVFDPTPSGQRKIILSTNIAETSITVEGVKYVIDCGVVKVRHFNSKAGMEVLAEVDISRAQATQRAGRAGRMAAGKCFRLYTAEAFESMSENTIPEIRRCSLTSVVLQLKSLHIDDILNFEFMDAPRASAVVKAEETLMLLRALDPQGKITPLGLRLTNFPIEPMSAMVLLAAKTMGVGHEAVVVVALTSTENLFLTSREHKGAADKCKAFFSKPAGDHTTLLSIYQAYRHTPKQQRKAWCESNGLNYRQLLKAEDVRTQLTALLQEPEADSDRELLGKLVTTGARYDPPLIATAPLNVARGASPATAKRPRDENDFSHDAVLTHSCEASSESFQTSSNYSLSHAASAEVGKAAGERYWQRDHEALRRALCVGYFLHAAFFNAKLNLYQTVVGEQPVHLHPSSVLFAYRKKPALVIFNSLVQTTKRYMKEVSVVYEEWLRDAAPDFLRPAQ